MKKTEFDRIFTIYIPVKDKIGVYAFTMYLEHNVRDDWGTFKVGEISYEEYPEDRYATFMLFTDSAHLSVLAVGLRNFLHTYGIDYESDRI